MFHSRMETFKAMKPTVSVVEYGDRKVTYTVDHDTRVYVVESAQSTYDANTLIGTAHTYTGYTQDASIKKNWKIKKNGVLYAVDEVIPHRTGFHLSLSLLDKPYE